MEEQRMKSFFNQHLDQMVENGAMGNQAYIAHFIKWDGLNFERLYQAEGNDIGYTPVTRETNLIGNKQKSTIVTGYTMSIEKNVIIEKGDRNYETIWNFAKRMPTGNSAVVDYMVGFFMDSEEITSAPAHKRYFALKFKASIQVGTLSGTDEGGTLTLTITSCDDITPGAMESGDPANNSQIPIFIPSDKIFVSSLTLALPSQASGVTIPVDGSVSVPLRFLPRFASDTVAIAVSDEEKCYAESIRDFVMITGLAPTGPSSVQVTVTSVSNPTKSVIIPVTVTPASESLTYYPSTGETLYTPQIGNMTPSA
jgi:hypothetical protein